MFSGTINTKRRRKIEKYLVMGMAAFLGTLFIISLIIGSRKQGPELSSSQREELTQHACEYLEGQQYESKGIKLDCSGFTKSVYQSFSIQLPPSSSEQYRKYGVPASEKLEKGDLVFFAINGKSVSHVGIYLGDDIFIHSPGINKAVRLDSLTNTYFKSCFISGGKINFEVD